MLLIAVPPGLLLSLFAGLMLAAAAAMMRRPRGTAARRERATGSPPAAGRAPGRRIACQRPGGNMVLRPGLKIIVAATGVGLLTGFFGVGGGFVIVPALVLALGFDMPAAVGTSLLVIAINSAAALAARLGSQAGLDWALLGAFTAAASIGPSPGPAARTRASSRGWRRPGWPRSCPGRWPGSRRARRPRPGTAGPAGTGWPAGAAA